MTELRQQLIDAAQDTDTDALLEIVKRHISKADHLDIQEILQGCSEKQITEIWDGLLLKSITALQEWEESKDVLDGIIVVAMATISDSRQNIPDSLFQVTTMLHGVIMSLPEELDQLRNWMVRLCEQWWHQNLEGKETVVMQAFLFLLHRTTLHGKASRKDIQRVWSLHEFLSQVDLDSESSQDMKDLLQKCMVSVFYHKAEEGRRFLSFILTLNPNFISILHHVNKTHMPHYSRSQMKYIGEIYFHAWRTSTGDVRKKLEITCLQDLMFSAIHVTNTSLSNNLRVMLDYIHHQKKVRGVDEMLLRLYEPFLWRCLQVANAKLRANATMLLTDIFPLQNPEATMEVNDELKQKQFNLLQDLLSDTCPEVRGCAAVGVCRICGAFWELIPGQVIKAFLLRLVRDLAWDSSSADVRLKVVKGLSCLVDNPMSHNTIKTLLPELKNLLHDSAEKVRMAFLDLLLKVKNMRAIKFWRITPMEHLLARLEFDTPSVSRRIVQLLFQSYMPTEKSQDVQLTRCILLLQENPHAARPFYQYAYKHMDLQQTCQFMLLLGHCVSQCVQQELNSEGSSADTSLSEEEKENESPEVEVNTGDGNLSAKDTSLMAGLLETIVILWESVHTQLIKSQNAHYLRKLEKIFSRALPRYLQVFSDARTCSALIHLAGFLPPKLIPVLSRSLLSKLKNMDLENVEDDYSTMLDTLCRWNKGADILELVSDWLEEGLKVGRPAGSPSKISKQGRHVQFTDPAIPKPLFGLRLLGYLTRTRRCQESLLLQNECQMKEMRDVLKDVLLCVNKRLVSTSPLGPNTSDEFLEAAFESYYKMEILLYQMVPEEQRSLDVFTHILTWLDVELISMMKTSESQPDTKPLKRTAADSDAPVLQQMALQIVKTVLVMASNMLLVGISDNDLVSILVDTATRVLSTDQGGALLPDIMRLVYQVSKISSLCSGDDDGGYYGDVVSSILSKIINSLAVVTRTKSEQADKVLTEVKPAMTEIVTSYQTQYTMGDKKAAHDVMATIMAATVAEMTYLVQQDGDLELKESITDLPKLSSFFLGMVCKKPRIIRLLVGELLGCIDSGALSTSDARTAALHIIYALIDSKGTGKQEGLKDCLVAMEAQINICKMEESQEENGTGKSLADLLMTCKTSLGMVA